MTRVKVNSDFKDRVYELVKHIPKGRVMTYGQIAAIAGIPNAGWEVGQIAHRGPEELPWQRVVNKKGGLAVGYPGGVEGHKQVLESEGVKVNQDSTVNVEELLWQPSQDH